MTKKRHSAEEIVAKLRHADDLANQGRAQAEIAKALGISVMTYHRWRKEHRVPTGALRSPTPAAKSDSLSLPAERGKLTRIGELQLENARLRRLVTDLLLEKIALEEALTAGKIIGNNS